MVGDLLADQFMFGEISRVSREAPVLILRHERTETLPGGAANCAANLASLGADVGIAGTIGDDEAGRAVHQKLLDAGIETADLLVVVKGAQTPTKVRILAGHAHSTRQQVIRIDYEGTRPGGGDLLRRLRDVLEPGLVEVVIVSDYNYGAASNEVADFLREFAKEEGKHVFVDSRFRLTDFHGLTSATPNEDEVEQVMGRKLEGREALEAAGEELRLRLRMKALLITRGSRGMMLVEEGASPLHIEAVGAREAVDVTGAGDTVIATYALALASGASFADAARIANHAGGLVVMKRGTGSVGFGELLASLGKG